MLPLKTIQKEFSDALLDRTSHVPSSIRGRNRQVERRFAVYRNNVFVSLTEALASRFPVCMTLVGEEFFRAMARIYVEEHPPRSPLLMTYGDSFADFIDRFPPAEPVSYLGDIARLEAARTRAYHATDADPVAAEELRALPPCSWERLRVTLHPSVEIVTSRYPIVSIWESHTRLDEPYIIECWMGEDALIARPKQQVELRVLPPGGVAFVASLQAGATFGDAATVAYRNEPRFDLVASLATLLVGRVFVALAGT